MVFNSIDFLIFFPIVVLVFFVIPRKIRYIWLLISSYYFYMSWNPKYALLIMLSTVITFWASRCIDCSQTKKIKKVILAVSLVSNLSILAVFKYANFFIENISRMFSAIGISAIDRRLDLLLPVGISFYTFQALSYTIDVYRGKISAERNILRYALYVSFFPQLVAGPIERSTELLPQIQDIEKIDLWKIDRVKSGLILMTWGMFQKLVIADRASILVDNVVNNCEHYGFIEISLAMFLFAVQIYCDFGGYTNIAIGSAKVMGFDLMNNFKQPYLATNIKDFWSRWHISLTSWFTDYVYIPLGGNRKGVVRKYINIIIVFCLSGLWHGASWNYVAWGLIHAIFRICGELKDKVVSLNRERENFCIKIIKVIGTFILVDFAWIFFVSKGLKRAIALIMSVFSSIQTSSIYELGLDKNGLCTLFLAIITLFVIDILHEKGVLIIDLIFNQCIILRWIIYLLLIWSVILLGIYGVEYDSSTFIYFQF